MTRGDQNISSLLETIRAVCLGHQEWIRRARKGEIKRTPEQIARKEEILRDLIAIGKIMLGIVDAKTP